ncbi:p21-C-terminal region-binding protein-domain-containing protein [Mycena floridula]|nr:p21-C-terminal region-binding protein-domain-containing protein [Mycena floridula]
MSTPSSVKPSVGTNPALDSSLDPIYFTTSMAKRKQDTDGNDSDDSDSPSFIDVDFDFFDLNADVDYHALKRLFQQLFQRDAELFELEQLTDLILSEPQIHVGTTVKTDGKETDPYAVLTVLNMHVHQNHPSIKALAAYFLRQAASRDPSFHSILQNLFAQSDSHVGLVLCERLINMPVQVIPPMYNMLTEEIKAAVDQNQPYKFSHLIFVSRTYHLTPSEQEMLAQPRPSATKSKSKRSKHRGPEPQVAAPADNIFSFHPEDDCIRQHSSHALDYTFIAASPEPRDQESFGLDTRGRMMLLPIEKFPDMVTKMGEVYGVS